MRWWPVQALGVLLICIGLAGLIEWWLLFGMSSEGIAHCLMITCGVLVEWADLLFAPDLSRAPRLEPALARRILGGYLGMCCLGGFLLASPRLAKLIRLHKNNSRTI